LLGTIFFYKKSRSHQKNKTVASSSSLTLLAPPSSLPHNWKHHVFPSFHGADVRTNFLSHIAKEFRSKGINLFIDNNIERSKSIGPELTEAIKGSRIVIVLLSKNYASSTWCLNELVEIMKCREDFGQTVMSLFYQVEPTHLKKQTGDFGKVFLKTCRGKTKEEIRRWKHALTEVAQIAGYHSKNWFYVKFFHDYITKLLIISLFRKNEAEMIEDIATDVSNKLNLSAPSSDFDGLVGMESQMTELEPLLQLDSDEVRKIGIWGPPEIGKTTIARYLFNRHSKDFQLSVFMDNIKRKYETTACFDDYSAKLYLQEQLMSKLTNVTDIKNFSHLGIAKDRLENKKVLVVLDDVDRLVQVEAMAKETSWFGPGSRIIITTQDQNVLKASGINHIHRVNLPSYDEALQIFCMHAFGQRYPKDGFIELACEVVSLVENLPLGLRVMGSYFQGMSEQDWTEALPRLRTHIGRDGEIASILISYDSLCDEDKHLALHIACFFNGESVDIVEGCLAKRFLDVTQGLRVLAEKSIISMEWGKIKMAELLVQLGRKLVREQSVSEPGKRQVLNDAIGIEEVLSDYKAIMLIFDYLSLQLLSNLKRMDLSYSRRLKELPDLSPATNLYDLDLSYCSSLVKLPSSIGNAINLNKLDLSHCSSFVELPFSIGNAINLQKLNLIYCSSLMELPSSIENAINLRKLNLSYCSSLVELPSCIGNAAKLEELDISHCSSLVEIPSSIGNAINLQKLKISHCSSLVELPSIMRNVGRFLKCLKLEVLLDDINLESLEVLSFSECSLLESYPESPTYIQELDPWMGRISHLTRLVLSGMKNLVSLPPLPDSLFVLEAENCESLERLGSPLSQCIYDAQLS
ncbi:unnamed protein product, partial [Brassica oleracea var. botrytis]